MRIGLQGTGKRWGLGAGLLAVGLIAAACGGGSDGSDEANGAANERAPREESVGAGEGEPVAEQSPIEEFDPALREVGAPTAIEGPFLPLDASVTPAGESIIREPTQHRFTNFPWETNWNIRIIALDELQQGGPPRDGIPPLDDPKFISVTEADAIYGDSSPVIQFEVNGDVRAYPLDILTWHEIVNDLVGGVPVSVTFCPLCNTAIAFERTLEGNVLTFGTSGLLRNSDLVMWDRQSESLWQQIGGKALVGDLVGAELTLLPATIVGWGQFRESFPDGIVLSRDTGFPRDYGRNPYVGYDDIDNSPFLFRGEIDERLSPFERVVTVEFDETVVGYPFALLEQVRALEEERDGQGVVVFWVPGTSSALDALEIDEGREVGATGVFYREVEGEELSFVPNPADAETFLDTATESVWNIFGEAVSGAMEGSRLTPKVHANHFWFAWAAFQPDTEIVTG